jgi:hypothetical protein
VDFVQRYGLRFRAVLSIFAEATYRELAMTPRVNDAIFFWLKAASSGTNFRKDKGLILRSN